MLLLLKHEAKPDSNSGKTYSEPEMYAYLLGCLKTAKLFSSNFKVENALKNYRNRLESQIARTISSNCLELNTQTLEYIRANFKNINTRIKSEFSF